MGTGARALEWANHLLTVSYLVVRDVNGDPVLQADGRPTLELDANGLPQQDPANEGSIAAFAAYVDTLDLYRQLVATFEQPIDELPQP